MSEDNTSRLTEGEQLILERIAKLEAQTSNTTRPLLDQLIKEMIETRETLAARLDRIEQELRSINHRLDVFSIDISKLRGEVREHAERIAMLESRPN